MLYICIALSRAGCRALQLYSAPERSTSLQLHSALHSTSSTPSLSPGPCSRRNPGACSHIAASAIFLGGPEGTLRQVKEPRLLWKNANIQVSASFALCCSFLKRLKFGKVLAPAGAPALSLARQIIRLPSTSFESSVSCEGVLILCCRRGPRDPQEAPSHDTGYGTGAKNS